MTSVTDGTGDYRQVLRRLAGLDARAAADRAEAVRWHDERVAAADDAVRTAEDDVRAAQDVVRQAQRERERVDARAGQLWADFTHRYGAVADRFGTHMPPPSVPRQRDRDAGDYLAEAEANVTYAPPQRPLNGATTVVFALLGVLGGLFGVAAYQVLRLVAREAGGDLAVGLPVVALIVMLLAPVLAVVGAKRVADRRGVGLDPAAVATVLIAGLLTAGLLFTAVGTR